MPEPTTVTEYRVVDKHGDSMNLPTLAAAREDAMTMNERYPRMRRTTSSSAP